MPAIGGRQPITWKYRAYSGGVQTIRLYVNEITAASIAGLLTQIGTLTTALQAVVLGVLAQTGWGEETVVDNSRAASKAAQVESEMLVRCIGATSEAPFSFRIPTIDYTKFNYADPPAGDTVILSGAGATTETTNLIAAIEALCKMPDDETEAVVVVGMEAVR